MQTFTPSAKLKLVLNQLNQTASVLACDFAEHILWIPEKYNKSELVEIYLKGLELVKASEVGAGSLHEIEKFIDSYFQKTEKYLERECIEYFAIFEVDYVVYRTIIRRKMFLNNKKDDTSLNDIALWARKAIGVESVLDKWSGQFKELDKQAQLVYKESANRELDWQLNHALSSSYTPILEDS